LPRRFSRQLAPHTTCCFASLDGGVNHVRHSAHRFRIVARFDIARDTPTNAAVDHDPASRIRRLAPRDGSASRRQVDHSKAAADAKAQQLQPTTVQKCDFAIGRGYLDNPSGAARWRSTMAGDHSGVHRPVRRRTKTITPAGHKMVAAKAAQFIAVEIPTASRTALDDASGPASVVA
jgi:hypothetical protein